MNGLEIPTGNREAAKVARIIRSVAVERGVSDTGGCRTFYTPAEWQARGEEYGRNSVLVVVYDGSEIRFAFDPTSCADEGWAFQGAMDEALKDAGYYAEPCTSWYCAIYRR